MKTTRICLAIAAFLVAQFVAVETAIAQSLVQNSDFSKWVQNRPSGWLVETGARSGNANKKSAIRKGMDGCLELAGDATTNNWQMLSQTFDVKSGDKYSLVFEAKVTNVRRENGQRDNCYVGVLFKDKSGRIAKFEVSNVHSELYTKYRRQITVPRTAAKAVVAVFLSKSGTLAVRSVSFAKVNPKESFQMLVDDMDLNYSYFQHKKIDWKKLTAKYQSKADAVAEDPNEFTRVILEMLSELKDGHIWVNANGLRLSYYRKKWKPNYSFRVVDRDLTGVEKFGKLGLVGKTADGFGYVRILSLANIQLENLNDLVAAIEKRLEVPGMIVDLRSNRGGSEYNGKLIAGMFAPERIVYAKQARRNGPKHSDLKITGERVIGPPRKTKNFQKPVVCLIGPGVVSSGEAMAMMFKAFKNCTTVGQPTRGSSGNPLPVVLPNGVEVWYSRWVAMLPNGTVIEDRGVKPEIMVEHETGSDATYAKAIEILKKKTR